MDYLGNLLRINETTALNKNVTEKKEKTFKN
jgi:hypothetical protein